VTIGEAYFRRLIRGRRFDLARELCELLTTQAKVPAVREHFAGYRQRLDLIGRPAPAITGSDPEGAEVRLDGVKGKVVLVVFWATWCPPCTERLPVLSHALELHEKAGFSVVGVNLDSGPDREQLVRKFLVEFGIGWPNILNGQGARDIAARYGVSEIPANVLIGRDGTVLTMDLEASNLLDAVAQAVGRDRPSR
jgi:thiol-disulfide isomerase/thioredoxin